MSKTLQDFKNGGVQTGKIEVWDNLTQSWRMAGEWQLVREPHQSTMPTSPLVTFDFQYAPGYDGPAVSPDLPPPQGHSSVVMLKGDGKGGKQGSDRAFDDQVPAILRQLTDGGNKRGVQDALLRGALGLAENDQQELPATSAVERMVMKGGVTLAGLRVTVDQGPMNYLPIMGMAAVAKEADELMAVVKKGDIISKVNFFANETRNSFAHTALGGATPKFLGYADGNVLVVKPVLKDGHVSAVMEHLMQRAQREAGIDAARTKIIRTSEGNTALLSGHYGYDKPASTDSSALPSFAVRRTACSLKALASGPKSDSPRLHNGQYSGMVATIHRFSSQPKRDREELAKRAIFHLMVNNTDNHYGQFEMMRNERNEWVLSPSYDVVPTPVGRVGDFSTAFGSFSRQKDIGSLDNERLWAALSKEFADEKGVPMPVGQLQAMAVDVAKSVLKVPDQMKEAGLSDEVIRSYSEKAFWDRADLQSFVKAHEGKTQQKDQQYSLSPR